MVKIKWILIIVVLAFLSTSSFASMYQARLQYDSGNYIIAFEEVSKAIRDFIYFKVRYEDNPDMQERYMIRLVEAFDLQGDILMAMNKHQEAYESYTKAVNILKDLTKRNPSLKLSIEELNMKREKALKGAIVLSVTTTTTAMVSTNAASTSTIILPSTTTSTTLNSTPVKVDSENNYINISTSTTLVSPTFDPKTTNATDNLTSNASWEVNSNSGLLESLMVIKPKGSTTTLALESSTTASASSSTTTTLAKESIDLVVFNTENQESLSEELKQMIASPNDLVTIDLVDVNGVKLRGFEILISEGSLKVRTEDGLTELKDKELAKVDLQLKDGRKVQIRVLNQKPSTTSNSTTSSQTISTTTTLSNATASLGPTALDHYNQAQEDLKAGNTEKAIESLKKSIAVETTPQFPAHFDLIFALRLAGKYDEALIEVDNTLTLFPNHELIKFVHYQGAVLNALRGDYDKAFSFIQSALAIDPKLKSFFDKENAIDPMRNDPKYEY